ncbi:hypothetical protein D3C73_1295350 [compost metagenome]
MDKQQTALLGDADKSNTKQRKLMERIGPVEFPHTIADKCLLPFFLLRRFPDLDPEPLGFVMHPLHNFLISDLECSPQQPVPLNDSVEGLLQIVRVKVIIQFAHIHDVLLYTAGRGEIHVFLSPGNRVIGSFQGRFND